MADQVEEFEHQLLTTLANVKVVGVTSPNLLRMARVMLRQVTKEVYDHTSSREGSLTRTKLDEAGFWLEQELKKYG